MTHEKDSELSLCSPLSGKPSVPKLSSGPREAVVCTGGGTRSRVGQSHVPELKEGREGIRTWGSARQHDGVVWVGKTQLREPEPQQGKKVPHGKEAEPGATEPRLRNASALREGPEMENQGKNQHKRGDAGLTWKDTVSAQVFSNRQKYGVNMHITCTHTHTHTHTLLSILAPSRA